MKREKNKNKDKAKIGWQAINNEFKRIFVSCSNNAFWNLRNKKTASNISHVNVV
jgi:hypothetical protein